MFRNDLCDGYFTSLPLFAVSREKYDADAVKPLRGKHDVRVTFRNLDQKRMGQSGQDACPVPGVLLATTGAAMIHMFEHRQRVFNDVVRFFAFDVGNEAHTTRIVLVLWVIKSQFSRDSR